MDYEKIKKAILSSGSIEELKRSGNMPPVPPIGDDQNYVFISYSHKDYRSVYCDILEFHKAGLRYWYDEGLPAGEEWDKVVKGKIEAPNCAGVIFYMSENLFLSRSVNKEIEFTVGEDGGKNYFCINLAGAPPMKILYSIQMSNSYETLEAGGFIDSLPCLTVAFSNKATYIPKTDEEDIGHIAETLKAIKNRFNVIAQGVPIVNDEEIKKLSDELDFARNFALKDGVLKSYMGSNTKVLIPDTVSAIGDSAFKGRKDIVSAVIPDTVVSIGKEAFSGCTELKDLVIPDDIQYLGEDAFEQCFGITEIGEDGVRYVGRYVVGCWEYGDYEVVTIRNGTVNMTHKALNSSVIEKAVLPDTMKKIPAKMFSGHEFLKEIVISEGVSEIGEFAFENCRKLEEINLPKGVLKIERGTFCKCRTLEQIIIPENVTSIGVGAFDGCVSLKSIYIPEKVNTIGPIALNFCKEVTKIVYGGSVDQWRNISKGFGWDNSAGDYIVMCRDGEIKKGE